MKSSCASPSAISGGSLAGRFVLTAGLGGMGGAQPLAGRMAGAAILCVEIDPQRVEKRVASGYLDKLVASLEEALAIIDAARREKKALSVALVGNAADVYETLLTRDVIPDIVTDQTSAHDLVLRLCRRRGEASKRSAACAATIPRPSCAKAAPRSSGMSERCCASSAKASIVFDNGNLIRTQAFEGGVERRLRHPDLHRGVSAAAVRTGDRPVPLDLARQ